jgi:hypothetical protein
MILTFPQIRNKFNHIKNAGYLKSGRKYAE